MRREPTLIMDFASRGSHGGVDTIFLIHPPLNPVGIGDQLRLLYVDECGGERVFAASHSFPLHNPTSSCTSSGIMHVSGHSHSSSDPRPAFQQRIPLVSLCSTSIPSFETGKTIIGGHRQPIVGSYARTHPHHHGQDVGTELRPGCKRDNRTVGVLVEVSVDRTTGCQPRKRRVDPRAPFTIPPPPPFFFLST